MKHRVHQLQALLPPSPSSNDNDDTADAAAATDSLLLPVEQLPPPVRMQQVEGFLCAVLGRCGPVRPWPVGLPAPGEAGAQAAEGAVGAMEAEPQGQEEEAAPPAIEV